MALLRISGDAAFDVADRLLVEPCPRTRRVHRAALRLGALPVVVLSYPAPGSFTGEDVVELELPGNPTLVQRVLRLAHAAGAEPAGPGAFSYRAYRAGRMSLAEAETLAARISAENEADLAAANRLPSLQRDASAELNDVTDALATLLALVEAGIDFTEEEDVVAITPADLRARLDAVLDRLELTALAWTRPDRDAMPRVVLTGPPSAGKSSLMNALLGRRRVVTDARPHTTRDTVDAEWSLNGGPRVVLSDTPGIEDAERVSGATPGGRQIVEADLVLRLLPPGAPEPALGRRPDWLYLASKADCRDMPLRDAQAVSIHKPDLLEALTRVVVQRLAADPPASAAGVAAMTPRQTATLHQLRVEVRAARDAGADAAAETVAAHLREALDAVAWLTEAHPPDAIIGRVFSTFCVGK